MADTIFDIEALTGDMTDEDYSKHYSGQSRRAPNFAAYQMLLNSMQIGSRKHVDIPITHADADSAARELRYNLNEAAKERTEWKTVELTEDEAAQYAANKRIERFTRVGEDETETHITRIKGAWRTEVKAPVVLRWQSDTREIEKDVTENGKTVKKTVKVPTRLYYVVVSTEAIKHRAKRSTNGTVTENGTEPVTENKPDEKAPAPEGAAA